MAYKTTVFQAIDIADEYAKYATTYGPDVFEAIVSFCQESGACDFSLALDLDCGSGQSTFPVPEKRQDTADAYVKYAPTYGPDVFEAIVSFCQESGACDFSLALDLGCGSGQSTVPLTKDFKRVIGLDVSQAQVDRAPKDVPGLSFRVGLAEDLSFLEDGCVDLVTVATAVHWMDVGKCFLEVERVLKPGGAFVVYNYLIPILQEPTAQEMTDYYINSVLKPCFPVESKMYIDQFKDLYLPFPGWRRDNSLKIEGTFTLEDHMNYLAMVKIPEARVCLLPKSVDSVLNFIRQRLTEVYQSGPEERRVKVTWPMYMLKGHKPQTAKTL